LNDWLKDFAPSTELRRWFNHDSDKWDAFRKRYFAELVQQLEALQILPDTRCTPPIGSVSGDQLASMRDRLSRTFRNRDRPRRLGES